MNEYRLGGDAARGATTADELGVLVAQAGCDLVTAHTVPAGLQILRSHSPDLVVAALRVNDYNGLQLVAMSPRRTPAIVIADTPDLVLEREARHLGAVYLVRPLDTAAFVGLTYGTLAARDSQ